MVKGVGLRRLSHRGSWVQIPPPAPVTDYVLGVLPQGYIVEADLSANLHAGKPARTIALEV